MDHAATEVEILIDYQYGRAEIARANGGRQSCAPSAGDNDVDVVVPFKAAGSGRSALCLGCSGIEHCRCADSGSAGLDEIAAAQTLLMIASGTSIVSILCHVDSPKSSVPAFSTDTSTVAMAALGPAHHSQPSQFGDTPLAASTSKIS
jgi:hypothetical protein